MCKLTKHEEMKTKRLKSELGDFFCILLHIYPPITRKRSKRYISSLIGVARYLSTTPRWGNPSKCLSQRHNKQTCRLVLLTVPLMLSVKQESCEYQFQSH